MNGEKSMPLKSYGVFKGRPIDRQLGSGSNPHYQVHVVDETTDYRIAVNVLSQLAPSEVEYLVESRFQHLFLAQLDVLPQGWHRLPTRPGGPALDFVRSNLFDPRRLVPLPFSVARPDNDLNEKIDHYFQRAMSDGDALLYAFGERWGPEAGKEEEIFGFLPGNGVHDIPMNQANSGRFTQDDGAYQDGALLLQFPAQGQWVGIFLKFQSQGWHSDDRTDHRLPGGIGGSPLDPDRAPNPLVPGARPTPEAPDGGVRIVAALVDATGTPEAETVTLLNATAHRIDLDGWALLDRDKHAMRLRGEIAAGDTLRVALEPPVVLSNQGGLITLLNAQGLRVDGVRYTQAQASSPGFSVTF